MFQARGPTLFELTVQAMSSTRGGYERLAPKFDLTPFRTPDSILEAVSEHLDPATPSALDVCCGTGAGAGMLRSRLSGRVVGFDFSSAMLAVAREQVPDVEFIEGNALRMPFDATFDLAVCFGAFGHFRVHEQPALLSGIYRALKPGGRFVFVTSRRPQGFNPTVLLYQIFNGVMRVRNRLISPKFVMYYLNFMLPEATERLEAAGFEVRTQPLAADGPFARAVLVEAIKPA